MEVYVFHCELQDAEIAVGPFTVTAARDSVIDFTTPILEDTNAIMTRKLSGKDGMVTKVFR